MSVCIHHVCRDVCWSLDVVCGRGGGEDARFVRVLCVFSLLLIVCVVHDVVCV